VLDFMAPEVGLEPTTLRLTAECSAIELLRSILEHEIRTRCTSILITNTHRGVKSEVVSDLSGTGRQRLARRAALRRSEYRSAQLQDNGGEQSTATTGLLTLQPVQRPSGEGAHSEDLGIGGVKSLIAFWIFLRIEKDGDVVCGEGGFTGSGTGPHYGLMVFARSETALELGWDLVEAGCGVAHDEPWLTLARVSSAHHAGLAGIVGGRSDSHSGLCDDAGNGVLLLVERESLDGASEIFYGEELVVPRDDGDADAIYIWIQQVGAVAGRMHPEIVDDDGGRSFAYVFRDEAKMCASIGSTRCELGFAVELMGDSDVVGHLAGVEGRGFREDRVQTKWGKSLIGAGFVGSGEEVLLGDCEVVFGPEGALGAEIRGHRQKGEGEDYERFRQ
jgi:hypothetical protein